MMLRNNNLFGNRDWGVYNRDDSAIIDAEYNWWGAANGPSGEGAGDGDAVSEYVEFDSWLTEPYVVRENHSPTLEITEPDGAGEEADDSYTITWTATDEDDDTLTISLYYDTDKDPDNGRSEIASGLSNSGSYHWDTSEVEEGGYYIYGKVDDNNGSQAATYSPGMLDVSHGGGHVNNPPVIEIMEPDGSDDEANTVFTIQWTASDEDGDTLEIDLYYDTDTNSDNGKTLIASGLGNSGSYNWDCSEVDENDYYIYGVADDNNGSQVGGYSSGTVIISHPTPPPPNHPPEITVSVEIADDYTYTINWEASDEDGDTLSIDLYYDTDTNPDNGKTMIAEELEDTGSYLWDISFMEDGDYYVYAEVGDGQGGEEIDYSGKFTIALPELLPDFTVISLEILPSAPSDGAPVTIKAVAENLGTATGSGDVEFLVDKIALDSRSLTLKSGKKETVTFFWTAVEGNHSIVVRIGVAEDPNTVNNDATQTVGVAGTPTRKGTSDDEFPVFWTGLVIIAILVVMGSVIVFRRKNGRELEEAGGGGELCPGCGSETTYSGEEEDYYCWECEEYVGEMG